MEHIPENRCTHIRDPGTCLGNFPRWFWNSELEICQIFTYGGCGGNGNNFATQGECLDTCHRGNFDFSPSFNQLLSLDMNFSY